MVLPVPKSEEEKLPPSIILAVDAYNLKLLSECVIRQSTLIDVIDDYNKRRR